MRCPNDDAELIKQTKNRDGMMISFGECPRCHGYFLDSFNANYVRTEDIERSITPPTSSQPIHPVCPKCQQSMHPYQGENIPGNVRVWRCPNGDGYFFPHAELFAFKKAQEAKLSYFKLWNIPMPNVASILLVVFVGVITMGVVTTYLQAQRTQTTQIQAREIVRYQRAFVSGSSVTVAVSTTTNTNASIHIGATIQPMTTTDHQLHTLFLNNLQPGVYEYYFTFTNGNETTQSDTYSFTIQ